MTKKSRLTILNRILIYTIIFNLSIAIVDKIYIPQNLGKVVLTPIQETKATIVKISVRGPLGGALGSGVVISEDGYILTNNHVVKEALTILVKYPTKTYNVRVVKLFPSRDLALLKIEPKKKLRFARIKATKHITQGDGVRNIGNPSGIIRFISAGIVSKFKRLRNHTYIMSDALALPGSSGGGMFALDGELIGIVTYMNTFQGHPTSISLALAAVSFEKLVRNQIKLDKINGNNRNRIK